MEDLDEVTVGCFVLRVHTTGADKSLFRWEVWLHGDNHVPYRYGFANGREYARTCARSEVYSITTEAAKDCDELKIEP